MATLNDIDLQTLLANIGGSAYNSQLVGPDWARWVQNIYARQRAGKEETRQRGMEAEDRELKKRLIEAQIANYAEPNYAPDRETEFDKKLKLFLENPQIYHKLFKDVGQTTETEFDKKYKLFKSDPKTYHEMYGEKPTAETKSAAALAKTADEFKKDSAKIDAAYQDELGKATRGYGLGKSQAMMNYMSLGYKSPQEAGKAYDDNYNKSIEDLKGARDLQIDSLLETYSELPQAQLMKKKRELEKKKVAEKPASGNWLDQLLGGFGKLTGTSTPTASNKPTGPTATDPKTGKRVRWDGKEWVLVQ